MTHSFKDDDFLCERCGYILNGLGPETNCPECDKPAYESHPANRTGNAWQRQWGYSNYLRTFGGMILQPQKSFNLTAVDSYACNLFKYVDCILCPVSAGLIVGAVGIIQILLTAANLSFEGISLFIVYSVVIDVLIYIILVILIRIEYFGIQLYGNFNNWRITKTNAMVICGYSTPGWVAGVSSMVFVLLMLQLLFSFTDWLYSYGWGNLAVGLSFYLLPWLVGMLWFETLVYIGMRRMKYANPPEAAPPWSIADAMRARGELNAPSADKSASPPEGESA